MKKNKISLIRDVEKSTEKMLDKEKQKNIDERIFKEKNEIVCAGMNILITFLVMILIIFEVLNIDINVHIVFIIIGIVEYVMLLIFCKKCLVKDNEMVFSAFIWSIVTLPLSVYNFLSLIDLNIFSLILPVIVVILQYQIANIIYKRAMKSEE